MEVVIGLQEMEVGEVRAIGGREEDEEYGATTQTVGQWKALMIRTEAVESSAMCSSGKDTTNDDHAGGDDDGGFTPKVVACQAVVCGQSCRPGRSRGIRMPITHQVLALPTYCSSTIIASHTAFSSHLIILRLAHLITSQSTHLKPKEQEKEKTHPIVILSLIHI